MIRYEDEKINNSCRIDLFLNESRATFDESLEGKEELIDYLAKNPEKGDEIPDTGGLRKLRWAGKGKDKRSGLRVIYYFYNDSTPIFLLYVYGKGEREDLKPAQKKQLKN